MLSIYICQNFKEMKNVRTLLFAALALILFTKCNKSDDKNVTQTLDAKLAKKWVLQSGNSLKYKWLELTSNGYYIIYTESNKVISNKYDVSATDANLITLKNYGTLKVNSVTSGQINFSVTALNSTTANTSQAFEGIIVADGSSSKTNLFCQLWNFDKYIKYNSVSNTSDTTIYPVNDPNIVDIISGKILITKYGTYFTTRHERISPTQVDTVLEAGKWVWTDASQTKFYYTYCDSCNIDQGPVSIELLNNSNFNFIEPYFNGKGYGFMSR